METESKLKKYVYVNNYVTNCFAYCSLQLVIWLKSEETFLAIFNLTVGIWDIYIFWPHIEYLSNIADYLSKHKHEDYLTNIVNIYVYYVLCIYLL